MKDGSWVSLFSVWKLCTFPESPKRGGKTYDSHCYVLHNKLFLFCTIGNFYNFFMFVLRRVGAFLPFWPVTLLPLSFPS